MRQGEASSVVADEALARLPRADLERLPRAAREESDACRDGVEVLMRLLESGLGRGVVYGMADLLHAGRQVIRLLRNHRRCQALAGNAEYYRDHPAVASRIASVKAAALVDPTPAG